MGLLTNNSVAEIDNIKRQCIIKNISASGTMIIMACIPKFIMNKPVLLSISVIGKTEPLILEGVVMRYEQVVNRKDIYGIGIQFIPDKISYEYKDIINTYIDKLEELARKR